MRPISIQVAYSGMVFETGFLTKAHTIAVGEEEEVINIGGKSKEKESCFKLGHLR